MEPEVKATSSQQIFVVTSETPEKIKGRRRQDTSWFSQWTYSYFWDMLQLGAHRELSKDDFPNVEDFDKGQDMANEILNEWQLEAEKSDKPSLWRVLFKVYGYRYSLAGILFFLEFIVQLSQGWFLARLLFSLGDPAKANECYYYAIGLAFDATMYAVLHHSEWFITLRTGMQIRVGLIAAIYQKIMNLSLSNVSSTGLIVNLVSNDVQRFEDLAPFLHYTWVAPLQVIGYMTLIYFEIGWAMFAAVGIIGLLVPIQYIFGRYFKKYRQITVRFRDDRIKRISDMISGIMVVKLYAWENPFMKAINEWRRKEMEFIWNGNFLKSINESIFFASGAMINTVTFLVFHFIGGELTPAKVFSTIVFLNVLKLSITMFIPKAFQLVSECQVSVDRLEDFFSLPDASIGSSPEEQNIIFQEEENKNTVLVLKNASFSWNTVDSECILTDLNLKFSKRQLSIICGTVGAGKSSLLHAILGDMVLKRGAFATKAKKIAYVSQQPWILSGTIKENILFGQPFDAERLSKSIRAASLDRDITLFKNGLDTFIGERGVTLSGGQRARVSLARAVYADADLYLLDDPLSAVDTKVGRSIFEQCIKGVLKEKTILLVTHQLQFLSGADQVIVVEHGSNAQVGSFSAILDSGSPFSNQVRKFSEQVVEQDSIEEEQVSSDLEVNEGKNSNFKREEMFQGGVSLSTYVRYFREGASITTLIMLVFLLFFSQTVNVLADFWLARWSIATDQSPSYWPIVLGVLGLATLIFSIVRAIVFFAICFYSSSNSFQQMLKSVFSSPMVFFQSNPHGRIMNRFSKDINLMDETLPQISFDLVQCTVLTLAVFVVAAIIVPYTLILSPFLVYGFFKLRSFYMETTRQVKRIEAITRSPVYTAIPATLEGLSVIRAFKADQRFQNEFYAFQDENTRMFFAFMSAGRWLGMRLDGFVAFLISLIIFVVLPCRDYLGLNPALIGLLITYLIQMTGTLQWAVRQSSEVENLMVSTERVLEYTDLPSEGGPLNDSKQIDIPSDWPSKGKVELSNMTLAYPDFQNPGTFGDPVLKGLNVLFEPGKKVGIVGRTGAGKSSMLQALFRLVEPKPSGSILIDSVDTSALSLSTLRSRISIIPQEPFCFKGTLRFNLDPFEKFPDQSLWNVLEAVELKSTVEGIAEKLEADVAENGSNWSVGERQLICLARAILRNSKLLVMDEPTSSIDLKTDQLIQKSIRSLFSDATILTIAHRLNSVIDYDMILVLDAGQVVEYGSPSELIDKPLSDANSWFSRMVEEMGPAARKGLRELIEKKFN